LDIAAKLKICVRDKKTIGSSPRKEFEGEVKMKEATELQKIRELFDLVRFGYPKQRKKRCSVPQKERLTPIAAEAGQRRLRLPPALPAGPAEYCR